MGTIKTSIGRSAALAAGLLLSGVALRAAHADECATVHGTLDSVFFTEGCTSPLAFCTAGTITKGGLLNGTDVFTLTSMTPTEVPGEVDYTGTLTFTSKHGTLNTTVTGHFSFVTGADRSTDTIVSGTGLFAGATGTTTTSGYLKQDGTGFISQLGGSLCISDDDAD